MRLCFNWQCTPVTVRAACATNGLMEQFWRAERGAELVLEICHCLPELCGLCGHLVSASDASLSFHI